MIQKKGSTLFIFVISLCLLYRTDRAAFLDFDKLLLEDYDCDHEHNMAFLCSHSSDGEDDGFTIVKLGHTGELLWKKQYKEFYAPGNKVDMIRFDGLGNIYVVGGTDPKTQDPLSDSVFIGQDFLAKFDQDGICLWKVNIHSSYGRILELASSEIALDDQNNAYMIGECHSNSKSLSPKGLWDTDCLVFLKYDKDGNKVFDKSAFTKIPFIGLRVRIIGFGSQSNIYLLNEKVIYSPDDFSPLWKQRNPREIYINCYNTEGEFQWRRFLLKTKKIYDNFANVNLNRDGVFIINYALRRITAFDLLKFDLEGGKHCEQSFKIKDYENKDGENFPAYAKLISLLSLNEYLYISYIGECYADRYKNVPTEYIEEESDDPNMDSPVFVCAPGLPDINQCITTKLDSKGVVIWEGKAEFTDVLFSIKKYKHFLDSEGNVYLQCVAEGRRDDEYMIVIKYDAATGQSTVIVCRQLDDYLAFLTSCKLISSDKPVIFDTLPEISEQKEIKQNENELLNKK